MSDITARRSRCRYATVLAAFCAFAAAPAAPAQVPDTTPPETSIVEGPAEGEVINDDAPRFGWAANEGNVTFTCIVDGVLLPRCEDAFINGASNGPHSFSVTATDAAGNTDPTPATRTFTVKLELPPQVPVHLPDRSCPLDGNPIFGTTGTDTRTGSAGTDIIYGRGGDDVLRGGRGADCLFGEAGRDRLSGGSGSDHLLGGAGADRLSDGSGRDTFSGGAGNDTVFARDTSRAGRLIADVVRCGTGRADTAFVDRRDSVSRDCERVRRR